ncbi:MAG: type II toxin-antitoxin system Phd/YefM family antitoxin [Candidatus Methylumidiphilus sp.]
MPTQQVSLQECSADFPAVFDRVLRNHEVISVCKAPEQAIVILDAKEYSSLLETLYLLSDPVNATRLREGIAQHQPTDIDFSQGVRGKFYQPNLKLNLPVYLDENVQKFLTTIAEKEGVEVSDIANALCEKKAISENADNVVLEHLRHIRSRVDQIAEDVGDLKQRMSSLENAMKLHDQQPNTLTGTPQC